MKKLWQLLGQIAFFVSIPMLHFYLRIHKRTRVLIVAENKALLVKGWLGSGKWILPGGGRHYGESAKDGVVRELCEETGIQLSPGELHDAGEAKFARYGLRFTYQQFIIELPKVIKPHIRRLEITNAVWMPIDEINDQNADRDVMELLKLWKRKK
jgi:8-oxo-dGTP pyrophosphatase MutT (NUDIX family)